MDTSSSSSPTSLAALSPIPDLCPPSSISLVTGASHSGKRQLLFAVVADLLANRAVFDPTRRPYAGTRADRPIRIGWLTLTHGDPQTAQAMLAQEMTRHGLAGVLANVDHFCHRALSTANLAHGDDIASASPLTRHTLLEAFSGAFGTRAQSHSTLALPDLLILDDIHTLLLDASPNSYYHVSRLLQSLQSQLHATGMTLLALAPATKLKTGERFDKIPDRILGSVAWGRVHSVWLVEQDGADDKLGARDDGLAAGTKLTVVAHGVGTETYWLEPDGAGLLRTSSLDAIAAVEWDAALGAWLAQHAANTLVMTSEVEDRAGKLGASRQQAQRWLRKQRDDGRLDVGGRRGSWIVRATQ